MTALENALRVHQKVRQHASIHALRGWINELRKRIPGPTLLALFINYFCLKGALMIFSVNTMLAVYKELGLEGNVYQLHSAVSFAPWAMKGLVGTLSDCFPLFGFKKRWYMTLVSILGFLSCACLSFASTTNTFSTVIQPLLPLPYFLIQLQIATCDLLCEGHYASIMKGSNIGSSLVSFVWFSIKIGAIASTVSSGILLDNIGVGICFSIMTVLSAIPLIPWVGNFLLEVPMDYKCISIDIRVWYARKRWFIFAIMMTVVTLLQIFITMECDESTMFGAVLAVATICCTGQFLALPIPLAKVNLFMFFSSALYLNLQGAMDYWFTANPSCVPDGPNFSFTYYQTVSSTVGILAGAFGLWCFQTFIRNPRYRSVFFFSTSLRCFASFTDYVILKRWNVKAGIPDKVLYLLGDSIISPIISMLSHMPSVMLTCQLCPKNVESTAYALLCAFGNYGLSVSKSVGVYFLQKFNIHLRDLDKADGNAEGGITSCTYDNLPLLLLVGHCLMPLTTVVLAYILIPDARMNEDLESLSTPERAALGLPSHSSSKIIHTNVNYLDLNAAAGVSELELGGSPRLVQHPFTDSSLQDRNHDASAWEWSNGADMAAVSTNNDPREEATAQSSWEQFNHLQRGEEETNNYNLGAGESERIGLGEGDRITTEEGFRIELPDPGGRPAPDVGRGGPEIKISVGAKNDLTITTDYPREPRE